MSVYSFERRESESANNVWRPIDRALLRWVLAHGGSELLATAAAWASLADGNGDTALSLRDATPERGMPKWSDADIAALRAEPMVSGNDSGAVTPFVLDADDRFYLWRNRRDETVVAQHIRQRRAQRALIAVDAADLDALFQHRNDDTIALQRRAVGNVAGRKLFVLTGGPGTGKTTTVLRMLLMLQRVVEAPLAIRVAAPTGKAAQRLVRSLRDGKRELLLHPEYPSESDWHSLIERISDAEATTLHRLLGYQPWNNRFRHDARHPLAADVVVVDEASMIDLAMMRSLLDALRPDATLILVGDADQLISIAAGSVLMDLVEVLESSADDDLVRLRHSFRAERALSAINESVRIGDRSGFTDAFAAAGEFALRHPVANVHQLALELRRWADTIAALAGLRPSMPHIDEATASEVMVANVLAALEVLATRQLLCALREGEFGAEQVNGRIERHLRHAWGIHDNAIWYPGRAILITRNDYAAGLYNGDIGVCLADADGLRVWFASVDNAGRSSARSFDPATLPEHNSAFAITIHKSQGSEYDRVAVLLPPDADSRILSRQLLYTGLSRAKHAVELWSTDAALDAALTQPVHRASGLASRLRQD